MGKFIKKYGLFIIAGALLMMSVLHIAFMAANTIGDWDTSKLEFPGTSQLELAPGKYMICYEYDNHKVKKQLGMLTIESGTEVSLNSSDIQAEITNLSHHTQMMLLPDQSFSYTIKNKSGNSLYSFHVKEQGEYQFNLQHSDISNLEHISITVFDSPGSKMVGMLKMIGLYMLLIVTFIIAGVIVLLRGNKRQSKQTTEKRNRHV